ncbi:MAG: AraC family transcriptional regulator [Clostridiales bacterium]|nr:AraC family transcriptional regulator [Clostridiales bacterium]MBQ1745087.1 AraC family transcriptional regulator [Clostridiales bacterium]MBQ5520407.1 AraC family transcriptional regulator [Clostridiales bacterium]
MKIEQMGLIVKRDDGSEIVNYDDPNFPSYIYDGWIAPKVTWEGVPHFHEDIEIMTVKEGRVAYFVNGKELLLRAGDTIVVNSNQIHYNMTVNGEVAKYVICVIHPNILANSIAVEMQAIRPITENQDLPYLRFRYINERTDSIRDLVLGLPDIRHDPFAVTKQFYQIWDIIRKQAETLGATEDVVSDPRMQSFKSMMHFIANNYQKQVTLADIAASGSVSKSLCNTLFHQYVGESPINYLMHLRCRKVAELLRSGKIPMTEIASRTGFGGVSYMSETFRKFFEKSPREYRKDWDGR